MGFELGIATILSMNIFVTVKPKAKVPGIQKIDENHFVISVKEPPTENKANFAVLEALAKHFNVSFSQLKLVRGRTSREKVFEIS